MIEACDKMLLADKDLLGWICFMLHLHHSEKGDKFRRTSGGAEQPAMVEKNNSNKKVKIGENKKFSQ